MDKLEKEMSRSELDFPVFQEDPKQNLVVVEHSSRIAMF